MYNAERMFQGPALKRARERASLTLTFEGENTIEKLERRVTIEGVWLDEVFFKEKSNALAELLFSAYNHAHGTNQPQRISLNIPKEGK